MENKTNKPSFNRTLPLIAMLSSAALLLVGTICITVCTVVTKNLADGIESTLTSLDMRIGEVEDVFASGVTADALFVVKEENGQVAVYDFASGKLLETLDVFTYSLPRADREYLNNGILVYTVGDLLSLYEDYTS